MADQSVRSCSKCSSAIAAGVPYMNLPDGTVCHQSCFTIAECAGCQRDIKAGDNMLSALDKRWHMECFKCSKCAQPLHGRYGVMNDKPFCPDCVRAAQEQHQQQQQQQQQAAAAAAGGSSLVCGGCKQPVSSGRLLQFANQTWHASCFVCHRCKAEFTSASVFNVDGNYHCAACVELLKRENEAQRQEQQAKAAAAAASKAALEAAAVPSDAPRVCVVCQRPASGRCYPVMGKLYHAECFKCKRCQQPIQGGAVSFIEEAPHCLPCVELAKADFEAKQQAESEARRAAQQAERAAATATTEPARGAPSSSSSQSCSACSCAIVGQYFELGSAVYCPACAEIIQRSTTCSKCRKNIASGVRFRKAMGKFYHMECFVCAHCKCVLPQEYKEEKGKVYCDTHYTQLFGKFKQECPRCSKMVNDGEAVEYDGRGYHAACFVCTKCTRPFEKGVFMPTDAGLFCRPCYMKGA